MVSCCSSWASPISKLLSQAVFSCFNQSMCSPVNGRESVFTCVQCLFLFVVGLVSLQIVSCRIGGVQVSWFAFCFGAYGLVCFLLRGVYREIPFKGVKTGFCTICPQADSKRSYLRVKVFASKKDSSRSRRRCPVLRLGVGYKAPLLLTEWGAKPTIVQQGMGLRALNACNGSSISTVGTCGLLI